MQNGATDNGIALLDEDGNDVTIDVLGDSHRTVLLLFPELPKVGVINSYALNELNDAALVANADVIGITPASSQEIETWRDLSMASYPIYNMDDSELKMLARGNPAVVYLEDGIIKWKRTLSSLNDVEQPIELSDLGKDYDADSILTNLMLGTYNGNYRTQPHIDWNYTYDEQGVITGVTGGSVERELVETDPYYMYYVAPKPQEIAYITWMVYDNYNTPRSGEDPAIWPNYDPNSYQPYTSPPR